MTQDGNIPSGEETSVVIGHPHTLLREGIARILGEAGFDVVGHAGDWTAVHNISVDLDPDIILLDVGLAGYNPDAIEELAGRTVIVVLTTPDTPERAATVISSGAKGYLSVGESAQEFTQALRIIAAGGVIVCKEGAESLKESVSTSTRTDAHGNLTDRETKVLGLLGKGLTNREIGEKLFVSEHTVKAHLHNVSTKLNLRNRQQAVAYAVQQGLVREEEKEESAP